MDRHKLLGEHRIPGLLARFSLPAITGMLVNALYNVVDRIFIGQGVGSLAIAGATIGFPVMIIGMAFAMLIGLGATSVISISLGEKRGEYAERVLGNAAVLLLGISLVLTALGLAFLDPILRLFGASDAVLGYARTYLRIIILGTPFMMIGFGMNHMIRGEGNPKMAMSTMIIGGVLNTILDPLFIFGFGWGVAGAAWATVISQAVTATWVLSYFLRGKSHLRFHASNFGLRKEAVFRILAVGSAPFAMQLAASLLNAILNFQLSSYGGDTAISAMGIIASVQMVLLMPLFGLNQGAQPIIGFNYGAKKFDRVRKTVMLAAAAATVYVTLGFLAVQFFPRMFVAMFNATDQSLLDLGAHAIRVFYLCLPVVGFQIISANYFQAVGKPTYSMLLSLSRQVLLVIPMLLILPSFMGLEGIWTTVPIADATSSLITAFFLLRELRNLEHAHRKTLPHEPTGKGMDVQGF